MRNRQRIRSNQNLSTKPLRKKRKRSETSEESTRPVDLPRDMTKEILSHLGVNDLLRYRSVCNEWRSLIDDPDFINMHLKSSKRGLFINVGKHHHFWLDLDTLDSVVQVDKTRLGVGSLLGSCNGLILTNAPSIWNPSTRNHMRLPPCDDGLPSAIGFGYDPLTADHKVVASIVRVPDGNDMTCSLCEFQLFCVKAKTWRKLGCNDAFSENYGYELGYALVENRLYWKVCPRLDHIHGATSFVFSFDLQTETHSRIALPFEETRNVYGPVDFDGLVCVVRRITARNCGRPPWCFQIWVMKDHHHHHGSWSMEFVVVPDNQGLPGYFDYVVPLKYYESSNKLLLDIGHALLLYDLKTNLSKPLYFPPLSHGAILGVQSLV